ncbi:hypothetical protein ILYODFUR_005658 [Ilyodon furcidens]|uniref:Agouti signaling protein n=1 Tax=Ilyodon furcidens TaxID=33524 RepID=A0ABV0SJ42_9TELE
MCCSGDEGLRPQAPVKPQRNRKAMSCDAGSERESPNNIEKPPNRKPPVKKPRLPQNRNKSLDLSGTCLSVFISVCVCLCLTKYKPVSQSSLGICNSGNLWCL